MVPEQHKAPASDSLVHVMLGSMFASLRLDSSILFRRLEGVSTVSGDGFCLVGIFRLPRQVSFPRQGHLFLPPHGFTFHAMCGWRDTDIFASDERREYNCNHLDTILYFRAAMSRIRSHFRAVILCTSLRACRRKDNPR